jgi:competence protein ComEA
VKPGQCQAGRQSYHGPAPFPQEPGRRRISRVGARTNGAGGVVGAARIGLALVAFAAAVAVAFALFRAWDDRSAPPIVIADVASTQPIVVDLRGEVAAPGVYELPPEARVQDAVEAGGGLTEAADLSTINLARRLRDGEVVVIAAVPPAGATPSTVAIPNVADAPSNAGRININTATARELEALPGIGEVTAGRIVAFREEHGPYRSVDDLIHVSGVSTRTIEGLRDVATVGP